MSIVFNISLSLTEAINKCKDTCIANFGEPDNDPLNCQLSACKACPRVTSGYRYKLFAGRLPGNSGIVDGELILPCSGFTNIKQDPCAG